MFKKVRICIMVCLLLVTTVISAYGSTGTQYEHNDVSDKSAWTEGLQDGERVIAVFKNTSPLLSINNKVNNISVERDSNVIPKEANLRWFPTEKVYVEDVGGSWTYAGASTISGGVLIASHSDAISNSFTGNLTVSFSELSAFVGFDITLQSTRTVGYSTKPLPDLENKGHRLEYRHKYHKYKVTQEKKYDRRASKSYGTEYVYPMEWCEREYRVVEYDVLK